MADKAEYSLLAAATGTGSWVPVSQGRYNWEANGTWNGATAQLQYSPDGGTTAINFDNCTLTANGGVCDIPIYEGHVRVSASGTFTSMTSKLKGRF